MSGIEKQLFILILSCCYIAANNTLLSKHPSICFAGKKITKDELLGIRFTGELCYKEMDGVLEINNDGNFRLTGTFLNEVCSKPTLVVEGTFNVFKQEQYQILELKTKTPNCRKTIGGFIGRLTEKQKKEILKEGDFTEEQIEEINKIKFQLALIYGSLADGQYLPMSGY